MSREERTIWLHAALKALDGIPLDLLREGCAEAMRRADHPSKVIPTIYKTVEARLLARRVVVGPRRDRALPAPVETAAQKAERLEVLELMRGLGRRLSAKAAQEQTRGRATGTDYSKGER